MLRGPSRPLVIMDPNRKKEMKTIKEMDETSRRASEIEKEGLCFAEEPSKEKTWNKVIALVFFFYFFVFYFLPLCSLFLVQIIS